MKRRRIATFWVLEDNSNYNSRERVHGVEPSGDRAISLRLYKVRNGIAELFNSCSYQPGDARTRAKSKAHRALDLVKSARPRRGSVIIASQRISPGSELLTGLSDHGLKYVVEAPHGRVRSRSTGKAGRPRELRSILKSAKWTRARFCAPDSQASYKVARLGAVSIRGFSEHQAVALSAGGIDGFSRGLIVGVTSLDSSNSASRVAQLLGWARWIRTVTRRAGKEQGLSAGEPAQVAVAPPVLSEPVRANLKIALRNDQKAATSHAPLSFTQIPLRGALDERPVRNVVELFAGAGGMGLGFLLSKAKRRGGYRVLFSGEVNPVFVRTLVGSHRYMSDNKLANEDHLPSELSVVDLRKRKVRDRVTAIASDWGGTDLLIGGPPCQGFSNANRNSWSSKNPNNRLIDTFLEYVTALRPRVLVMENVQGILWTPQGAEGAQNLTVAQHVSKRLKRVGYEIFPKLLDAAWYGVPQHRSRFFLVGLHHDLGYRRDDFGDWGPFPQPTHGPQAGTDFVTVRDALSDLPRIGNGASTEELLYAPMQGRSVHEFLEYLRHGSPEEMIWDHVTSRHSEYVIDRYRRIPAGGNWSDIADMMTNYADVERTHSNIYRRLSWDSPSITIGHYRKSMLVHPSQHRGLSLREASRLQSFPDWFRFAGGPETLSGGLTFKQQQLENAVCPLVSKAIADYFSHL